MSRSIALGPVVALALAVLGGCSGARPPDAAGSPASAPTTAPATSSPTSQSSRTHVRNAGDIALVRAAIDGSRRLVAIDTTTMQSIASIADAPVGPDRRTAYETRAVGDDTEVRAVDAFTGVAGAYRTIRGRWRLPVIGTDETPIGLSSDGLALVLVGLDPPAGHSRFAVLDASLRDDPTVLEFAGDFDVDGLSPAGAILYLVERRDGRDYAIRSADVTTATLDPDPVVDKREGDEAMVGRAVGRVISSTWLHTVYLADEPFLHSLDASNRFTFCIELDRTLAKAREVALAVNPDGQAGWIADLTAGTLSRVDVGSGTADHGVPVDGLAVGSRAGDDALSFDPVVVAAGHLVIATDRGIVSVDTATRHATVVSAGPVEGLGRSSSGTIVAIGADGRAFRIEP